MSAASLGKLLDLIADGTISGRIAKDLFVAMEETGKDPAALVEERGLKQVTDSGAIEAAIKAVIDANPGQVAAYKAKPTPVRLVRRPGHEVDRRQGQSQGRQRASEEGSRRLTCAVDVARARLGHFVALAGPLRRLWAPSASGRPRRP